MGAHTSTPQSRRRLNKLHRLTVLGGCWLTLVSLTAGAAADPVIATRISHIQRKERIEGVQNAERGKTDYIYAITLSTSKRSPLPIKTPADPRYQHHQIYVLQLTTKQRQTRYQLKLGFFKSHSRAVKVRQALIDRYPQAKVARTGSEERWLASRWYVAAKAMLKQAAAKKQRTFLTKVANTGDTGQTVNGKATERIRMERVLEAGRRAIAEKDYRRAVLLYTSVLQSPLTEFHPRALEMLALARERNGQLAHAKAEYEAYLDRFPEAPGVERVKQRLAGIITAADKPKPSLKSPRRGARGSSEFFGSLAQYYRVNANLNKAEITSADQSYFATDANVFHRYRSRHIDVQTRFSGSYQMGMSEGLEDDPRVYYGYVDAAIKPLKMNTRLGRQSHSGGGILGRFDGAYLDFRINPLLKVNVAAGYPFYLSSTIDVQKQRFFQSLSVDIGTFAKHWDLSPFVMVQQSDGVSDREAAGFELRYFSNKQSYFTLLDYDYSYSTINTALFLANWRIAKVNNLSLTLDYRKSPTLTTSNALQGQGTDSLETLLQTYSEDELRRLAEDRTPDYTSAIFNATRTLNARLDVGVDVTAAELSDTPASGNVPATPSTGTELYYGAYLITNRLVSTTDITMFALRYADTQNAKTMSFIINNRFRLRSAWRFNPYVRLDRQTRSDQQADVTTWEPALRFEYKWRNNLTLNMDFGMELSDEEVGVNGEDRKDYFVYAGYRWDIN